MATPQPEPRASALSKVYVLMSSQVASRVLTFLLNVLVARRVGLSVYGLSSIDLYLLDAIVLLPREGLRRAALRVFPSAQGNIARQHSLVANLCWCALPLGALVALLAGRMTALRPEDAFLTSIGSLLTLAAEPWYSLAECNVMFGLRAKVEAVAVLCKCVATFVLVVYAGILDVRAFALAQVVYGAMFLLGFLMSTKSSIASMLPDLRVGIPDKWLAVTLVSQSVWKLLLTEGEKFVMVLLKMDVADQGVYGLVQNLGSLVARFIFLPIEESSFAEFSYQAGLRTEAGRLELRRALSVVLKVVSLVGALAIAFGPPYSFTLLDVVYGAKWSSTHAPSVLGVYCVYVLFMALNGVTEAFVNSCMSPEQLQIYNVWLLVFSGIYLALAVALLPYGANGMIVANICNMSARTTYSATFIWRYFGRDASVLWAAVPAAPTLLALVSASVAAHVIEHNVLVGCVALAGVLWTIWMFEYESVVQISRNRRRKRKET